MTAEAKIQEFKAASLSLARAPLTMQFSPSVQASLFGTQELERMILDAPGRIARDDENDILLSNGSRNDMERGQDAAKRIKERAILEKVAREKTSELMNFLELIADGDYGGFMADGVFGSKSDAEIEQFVSEYEAGGRSLEADAQAILGDDMPERMEGESQADYHRRLLQAVTKEAFDEHGNIKPEYADSPLVEHISRDEDFVRMDRVYRKVREEGPTPENIELVEREVARDYAGAEYGDYALEDTPLQEIALQGQGEHRELASDDGEKAELTASFFDTIDGGIGAEGAIKEASTNGLNQFNASARPAVTEEPLAPESAPGAPDPGNRT